jgi:hypothetical protein
MENVIHRLPGRAIRIHKTFSAIVANSAAFGDRFGNCLSARNEESAFLNSFRELFTNHEEAQEVSRR